MAAKGALKITSSLASTAVAYPPCRGVHEYFESQVKKNPSKIAVKFESQTLTYLELDQRSNQLAHYLRKRHVTRDTFVALLLDRSLDLIVAVMAVLKAGGAYVPMEPEHPKERLFFLVEDVSPQVIITQSHLVEKLPAESGEQILCIDTQWGTEVSSFPREKLLCQNHPSDLAYLTYTSGSTGAPKGCQNTHEGLANYLQWLKHSMPLGEDGKMLHKTPLTFVDSVIEIIEPLISGAEIVIAKPGGHRDVSYLINIIKEEAITEIRFVPSMLRVFIEEKEVGSCTSLKRVITSGEALSVELMKRFYERLPTSRLFNLYGNSEMVCDCLYWECDPKQGQTSVPIGYPVSNNIVYVLDENGRPVTIGEPGELFIGGVQVARGYWNRPELTQERFLKDPFSKTPEARMFKTGDLVRQLPDGAIEYQGRADFQVKLRGFRIELGEIENVLLQNKALKQVGVVFKKLHGKLDSGSLVAYFVTKEMGGATSAELKDFLKRKLPEYMVPSAIIPLEAMPLTTSGKIDRKALMDRVEEIKPRGQTHMAPLTGIEEKLIKLFQHYLKMHPISVSDNFFDLGGDSLLATQVVSSIRRDFNIDIPLEAIFNNPTVEFLAKQIDLREEEGSVRNLPIVPVPRDGILPLSFLQEHWWQSIQTSHDHSYFNMCKAFYLTGPLNIGALEKSLHKLINRHEILRTRFEKGPQGPVQIIDLQGKNCFEYFDLQKHPAETREDVLKKLLTEHASISLDAENGPLLVVSLFILEKKKFVLFFKVHHFIYDGWSEAILLKELETFYAAEMAGKTAALPALNLQFADYAAWERKSNSESLIERELSYWDKSLEGIPAQLGIPRDFSTIKDSSAKMGTVRKWIAPEVVERLKILGNRQRATLNMVFLATFKLLLNRLSSQDDIVVGNIIATREKPETQNLIGLFIDTLVIRTHFSDEMTFVDLLANLRKSFLSAHAHQEVPFVKLIEMEPWRSKYQNGGLFQARFNFLNFPHVLPQFRSVVAEEFDLQNPGDGVRNDLYLCLTRKKNRIRCELNYKKNLFSEKHAQEMLNQFISLLNHVSFNPDLKIKEY